MFGDASNGLFLTSPRRTGKSTFLQADLSPELCARGVLVVYTDLWESRDCDPSDLIKEAIARAFTHEVNIFSRTVKRSKLEAVNLAGWLKIDTSKVGRSDGTSLADALRGLKELSGKPVALIIDEAQQALLSNEGEAMMFALKSARDQMNRPGKIDLMLIMSGSVNGGVSTLEFPAPTVHSVFGRCTHVYHLSSIATGGKPLLPLRATGKTRI